MVPTAAVTITNDATGLSATAHADDHGLYILTGRRSAVCTIPVDSAAFRKVEEKNVVLQVDQQTTIDFTLHPLGVITTVEVTTTAPLSDRERAPSARTSPTSTCETFRNEGLPKCAGREPRVPEL